MERLKIQLDKETILKQIGLSDSIYIFETIDSQREYLGKRCSSSIVGNFCASPYAICFFVFINKVKTKAIRPHTSGSASLQAVT